MTGLNLRECGMSLFIALNERMDEPDSERSVGGNERCMSRPVIGADGEFG